MRVASAMGLATGLAACSLLLDDGYSSGQVPNGGETPGLNGPDGGKNFAGEKDSGVAASAYRDVVLADGPVAYWPLDETTGWTVGDVSGHGHDGEIESRERPLWGQEGIPGSEGTALRLDGRGGVIFGDKFDFPGRSPFTIEAWIRPDPPVNTWRSIFEKLERRNGSPHQGTYFWVKNDDRTPLSIERWAGGNIKQYAASRSLVQTDRFTHVAAVVDANRCVLFVDGARVDSQPHTGDIPDISAKVLLGSNWVGLLDEVAI